MHRVVIAFALLVVEGYGFHPGRISDATGGPSASELPLAPSLQALTQALFALGHAAPIRHQSVADHLHSAHAAVAKSEGNGNLASLDALIRHVSTRRGLPQMAFENFNEASIKAVMSAQSFVGQNNATTSDAILYGCFESKSSTAARILNNLGLTPEKVKNAIKEQRSLGLVEAANTTKKEFSPEAANCIKRTVEFNKGTGMAVDTVHLLLAIITQEGCAGQKVLKSLGVTPEQVQKEADKLDEDDGTATVGAGRIGAPPKAATLEQFSEDLTKKAKEGKLDPIVGRDDVIDMAMLVLKRRRKNNPVFLGDPGVGKTAIAEGIAQRIAEGRVPSHLKDKRVLQLDVAGLLAGTKYRGDFEERLTNIIKEVVASEGEIILMIDEMHTIVGAGGSVEGASSVDAGNIMKPKLANGELQVMGATTVEEYRKFVAKDKALERRFKPIDVPEPSLEDTIEILKGIAYKYEDHHGVSYTPEGIEACAKLAEKYIADRFLPDKAIDALDMAGARVGVFSDPWMQEQSEDDPRAELAEVVEKLEVANKNEEYELCAQLVEKRKDLEKQIEDNMGGESEKVMVVTEVNVSDVVSEITGIPVSKVGSDESSRLLELEDTLHDRVIGQDEAVVAVSKAVRRARSGLKDANRPVASFIFAGPTGVGKTELCKALSKSYYGSEKSMIRFDMSEFMERHTISKLIGSPPGYVGYGDETQLCDKIRRNPYSLILFDEIEKAHPDIFNLMLQILEDGRLKDSKGRLVSFKNALIIMTSNVGAQNIEKTIDGGGGFGFQTATDNADDATYETLKDVLLEEMKNKFRPEFINRLDDTIVFRPLTKDTLKEISELEFKKVYNRLEQQYNITAELTDEFKDKVLEEGFDPKFGARPLRRAISRLLEDELSTSLLNDPFVAGETIVIDLDDDGKVVVKRPLLALEESLA
jgi:ATP-dependent Clp protease ATP-binding subunit ClpC